MPRSLTQESHLCLVPHSVSLLPLVPSLCLRRVEVKCEKLSRWQPGTGSQGPTGLELLTTTCLGVCTVPSDLGQVNVPSGSSYLPQLWRHISLREPCYRSQLWSADPRLETWPHPLPLWRSLFAHRPQFLHLTGLQRPLVA